MPLPHLQICRKGSFLLLQLAATRRSCARAQRDARLALSQAQEDAQKEWGSRVHATKHEAALAATNVRLMALDTQKLALTALGEVRREVMSKLDSGGPAKGEWSRIMELEERVHENELEILDWKRALKKVRMWCKFREGSLQVRAAAIVQEAVRHVDELHREKLESAEAHDLNSRCVAACLLPSSAKHVGCASPCIGFKSLRTASVATRLREHMC